ncbi:MAG TPA: hypothetical protein EYQ54_02210 [Myxococcales bacterium]|nr:hypothetical protein [Myxococcales bacterium]
MHEGEVETDPELVSRLLAAQFPRWADLPVSRVDSAGTDNALYRLGDDMAVRLPRVGWAMGQVEKEHQWLPQLAPLLPLQISDPLAKGEPGEGYPWQWSVYRWLEGENATLDRVSDPNEAATELAEFIGDRTYKLPSGTTSEPGRYVKSLGDPVTGQEPSGCWAMSISIPSSSTNSSISRRCSVPSSPEISGASPSRFR